MRTKTNRYGWVSCCLPSTPVSPAAALGKLATWTHAHGAALCFWSASPNGLQGHQRVKDAEKDAEKDGYSRCYTCMNSCEQILVIL